jgi:hypothetical protein
MAERDKQDAEVEQRAAQAQQTGSPSLAFASRHISSSTPRMYG